MAHGILSLKSGHFFTNVGRSRLLVPEDQPYTYANLFPPIFFLHQFPFGMLGLRDTIIQKHTFLIQIKI